MVTTLPKPTLMPVAPLVDASQLGLPQLLYRAPRRETAPLFKRPACATNNCETCPFMREGGSC